MIHFIKRMLELCIWNRSTWVFLPATK